MLHQRRGAASADARAVSRTRTPSPRPGASTPPASPAARASPRGPAAARLPRGQRSEGKATPFKWWQLGAHSSYHDGNRRPACRGWIHGVLSLGALPLLAWTMAASTGSGLGRSRSPDVGAVSRPGFSMRFYERLIFSITFFEIYKTDTLLRRFNLSICSFSY